MDLTHPIFEPPNTPSHFIARYGDVVHRFWHAKLGAWIALCGVTEVADPKWRHMGPTTCDRCLRGEGR